MERVLLISGSMGAGKTSVLGEASDLLTERGLAHAAIDLDAIGMVFAPGSTDTDLVFRNLESLSANFSSAGIVRLLLAGAIESRTELRRIRQSTSAEALVVCRLRAPLAEMERRVAARERGVFSPRYVNRVRELDRILDGAALEEFTLDTGDVPVTDVARELLVRAGWV